MASLLYKQDFDEARDRMTRWWTGEDIGRPAMHLTAPRAEPLEDIPAMPAPEGWTTNYSTTDYDYRVHLSRRACIGTHYLAEACPTTAPDLAPNCLALYLGCRGVDGEGTVWCEPFIEDPEQAEFRIDPDNHYWSFSTRLAREQLRLGAGKFLCAFPDFIEGLDTLAAMRDTELLLVDLLERPAWVVESLDRITEQYFVAYDHFYEMFKDDRGGSHFWAWAPGKMAKLQCDFAAMISPEMFGDFMVPVLTEMTERLDHTMYHWDGPGALEHHDHLLSIPGLDMLQWTPGAGAEPTWHRRWWPYYHKSVEAGKSLLVNAGNDETLDALKREFGPKLKRFLLTMGVESPAKAEEVLAFVSD